MAEEFNLSVENEVYDISFNEETSEIIVDIQDNVTAINVDFHQGYYPFPNDIDLTGYYTKVESDARYKPISYTPTWSEVSGKPTVFTPSAHTHPISQVDNLQSTLDNKQDVLTEDNVGSFMDLELPTKLTPTSGDTVLARDNITNKAVEIPIESLGSGGSGLALGETPSTAYRGDRGKIAYDHSQTTGNPHNTTKNHIGLGNVPNLDTTNAVNNSHTHSNKSILDLITEPFTTSLKSLYDGVVTSINNLSLTGQRLITSGEITKLTNTSGTNTGDETTSSIQTKRPLKTIEGQSLEGVGDINLNKSDVGLGNVDNTSDFEKNTATVVLKNKTIDGGTY